MGRTLPTSTQLVQEFEANWKPYRRALRKEDQAVLDELFAMMRFQSAAIAYSAQPEPFQAFTLAMLGGVLRRVIHLEILLEGRARAEDAAPATEVAVQRPFALLPSGDIKVST